MPIDFETLTAKGRNFLGTRYPILAGAMSWVSDVHLVSAVSENGGFGVYACAHIPKKELEKDFQLLKEKTTAPFGVNLVTLSPIFEEQFEVIREFKPGPIVFAGRLPRETDIERAKKAGLKVMTFAPNLKSARRMISAGADALIIEGHEAGGHVGSVSTLVLLQEILFEITEVPVFVAGGIATGKMGAHLLIMGAAGIQLGTWFMLTEESGIARQTKERFIHSEAKDALVSFGIDRRLGVVPVRALRNPGSEEFTKLQMRLLSELESGKIKPEAATAEVEKFWLGALRRAMRDGDLEYGSLMAGNCVGLIKKISPVKEVIQTLVHEMESELARIQALASKP